MTIERKPLDLFYVLYEDGNPTSKILAFLSLTPNLVVIGLFAAFVATRRIWWLWTFLGVIFTDILCIVAKQIINQPRPLGSYKGGPGMPSEHAAFAVFFAVYLIRRMILFVKCHNNNNIIILVVIKILATILLGLWAWGVVISRHHLGVHSWEQLLVGSCFGSIMAVIWLSLEQMIFVRAKLQALQRFINSIWKLLDIHCDDGFHTTTTNRDD